MAFYRRGFTSATLGLLLVGAGASSALALGGVNDTRTAITVNCAIGEGSSDNQVILPGETLSVTLLNCENWTVDDLDAGGVLGGSGIVSPFNTFTVPNDSEYTFTVDGAANIEAFSGPTDARADELDIDVYVATPGYDPTEQGLSLNLTQRLTMPEVVEDFAVDLDLVVDVDLAGEETNLGGIDGCGVEAGYHPYQSFPIVLAESGSFVFRVIDVTPFDEDVQWGQPYYPAQDFLLAVYEDFDPADPGANLVACQDDREDDNIFFTNAGVTYVSEDQAPEFSADLGAGNYTLVLSTFRTISSADWASGQHASYSGTDKTWTPTEMTALFELWGPEGSITAADDTPVDVATEAPATLAATGADLGELAPGLLLSAVLIVTGLTVIAFRRRSPATN